MNIFILQRITEFRRQNFAQCLRFRYILHVACRLRYTLYVLNLIKLPYFQIKLKKKKLLQVQQNIKIMPCPELLRQGAIVLIINAMQSAPSWTKKKNTSIVFLSTPTSWAITCINFRRDVPVFISALTDTVILWLDQNHCQRLAGSQ